MKLKMVINLFGGPGTGKSTLASELFCRMKKNGLNVELITEYAKELTWEKRHNILAEDQLYIFAKQHRKLIRVKDHVEYAICDSPLVLSDIYYEYKPGMMYDPDIFHQLLWDVYTRYPNLNIFLERSKIYTYQEVGRNQSYDDALLIDKKIKDYLESNWMHAKSVYIDNEPIQNIIKVIREKDGEKWDSV